MVIWERLLDRARDLIIQGPAHRGANGVAMPSSEDDQDDHFIFNHPERGGLLRRLGAVSLCCCCLDPNNPQAVRGVMRLTVKRECHRIMRDEAHRVFSHQHASAQYTAKCHPA